MDPVRSWWNWCTESFGHMFLGVTVPILLIAAFFVLVLASGGNGLPKPPRSEIAGVCLYATPGAGTSAACATPGLVAADQGLAVSTATTVPPTPTPRPRSYVVRSGDTLSRICAAEAPGMALDDCIDAVIGFSDLDGPDELFVGQELLLPAAAKPAGTPAPGQATPAAAGNANAGSSDEDASESNDDDDSGEEPEDTETGPDAESATTGDHQDDAGADGDEADEDDEDAPADDGTQEGGDGAEPTATPSASLVPMLSPLDVKPTLPEGFDPADARVYIVQPGESLLSICFDQVPDMDPEECAGAIVALNGLGGADEIFANQGLLLP